jgi:uncharacterized protein (DUF1330 family)
MDTIEMDNIKELLSAAAAAMPADEPIFMINLVRYRERADYGERADAEPCSGSEAYLERYIPAFNKVIADLGVTGINLFYTGAVVGQLIAPADEKWDTVVVVEYPNFAAFRRVAESSEYQGDAEFHRAAALEDSRLFATTKMESSA